MIRRRLFLQIYVGFAGILLLFLLLAGIYTFVLMPLSENDRRLHEGIAALASDILPAPDEPTEELQRALERFGQYIPARVTIRTADGGFLAAIGDPLPAPRPDRREGGWFLARGTGPTVALVLSDGRWLLARFAHGHEGHGIWVMVILAVAIAIGAYPVSRRIASRLERLQRSVDELGAGDLRARVEIEGNDEVARLARSFNRAADRIARLVDAQKTALASASHELRSPLTRMRVAIELLKEEDRPELRERISKDIEELDELIGELLLASRLDALEELEATEEIDLLALTAEEAAGAEAQVTGEPVRIEGDPRMLRRMIRNLLENARRYAEGSAIEVSVERLGTTGARLYVSDRGPGVPEKERERIFEPFYRLPGRRARPDDGGVGLGLALVRRIAHHHGGTARCLSRQGGGTCFEVHLRTGE